VAAAHQNRKKLEEAHMKKAIVFILSLMFLFLNVLCNKNNPITGNEPFELIPLKVGNTWIGTDTRYDSNGVVRSTAVKSIWVSADTILNGKKYFSLYYKGEQSVGVPDSTLYAFARNSDAGYSEKRRSNFDEELIYGYPYSGRDSDIVSTSEAVTVPAGKFYCVVYKYPAGIYHTDSLDYIYYEHAYICPTIGIIKIELHDPMTDAMQYLYVLNRVILH
jgi:hypothetical protein